LARTLRQLGSNKRVLVIAAHPDDENTQLLTLLGRGEGAQVAYLSLTLGEGGQNLLGPELGPALGVIRTEELLAARELDGGRQFFTRAYDYGYSRSVEEAFRFWPRDTLLRDVVEVVRRFKPQILVSVFSGTPRDGHGQHQAAGLLARQAFDVLRDSTWGPVKLYRSSGFDTAGATLSLPTGELDPLTGQSYFQIAMASRSRHRSQDMGQLQRPGPNAVHLALIASRRGTVAERGMWDGVDTTTGPAPLAALIDSARAALNPWQPRIVVPLLARALGAVGADSSEQRRRLEHAIANAAGVVLDAIADDDIVTPGQRVQVEVTVWNAGQIPLELQAVDLRAPDGWEVQPLDAAASSLNPGAVVIRRFALIVPRNAPASQPYFLRRPLPRGRAVYDWSTTPMDWRGLPFEPPLVEAGVRLRVGDAILRLGREAVYRYRDQGLGEVRRPLLVSQPLALRLEPAMLVWPTCQARNAECETRNGVRSSGPRFSITVINRTRGPANARVEVAVPSGWALVPAESLWFRREDEERSFTVDLEVPENGRPGVSRLAATVGAPDGARSGGQGGQGGGWLQIIDYPHIRPRAVSQPSFAQIRVAELTWPALGRVGYIRGAADRVPEALLAAGVPLELLSPDSLAGAELSGFDAVVVGSRAYEVEPGLVTHNQRLLDYARAGGLVIVQYQQYDFAERRLAPYAMSIGRPHGRVTDEHAPVTALQPAHPVFHEPNELRPSDWQGWIQERGLYFASEWDASYVAVLESHDPSEPPLKGGLLIAPLGKGTYVYTGLSFFRQLPAGVAGAYRLFANLLALGRR
jgi:LmbE family N-acetylglucosaminyl deacetylase